MQPIAQVLTLQCKRISIATITGRPIQRRPSPLRQWCIPSLFQISPLFPKKCPDSVENFHNFTFSTKKFRFSSDKISDDLFYSSTTNLQFPPIFSVSVHFPLFSPTFANFPFDFVKFRLRVLYILSMFSFPPSLTTMHLCITQIHSLDAPGPIQYSSSLRLRLYVSICVFVCVRACPFMCAVLHSNRLTHTDLKPENILFVNSDCEVIQTQKTAGRSKKASVVL